MENVTNFVFVVVNKIVSEYAESISRKESKHTWRRRDERVGPPLRQARDEMAAHRRRRAATAESEMGGGGS
jgi:hypothetical protein